MTENRTNGGPAVSAWQSIETAPKDGTTILLYAEAWELTHDTVQVGHFEGDGEGGGEWVMPDFAVDENEPNFDPDEGGDGDDDAFLDDGGNCGPTHWMPLPAPPLATRSSSKEA